MINPTHHIEHLCGIPFIYEILKELHIIRILNTVFTTHRNWTGLPIGETIAIWVCYCLAENDHRMCPLEKWVEKNNYLLSKLVNHPFSSKCFTDDHLARILSHLHDSDLWNQFESELNSSTLRIYGLEEEKVVRIDMTTASSDGIVSEEGLIQFGNSKDDPSRPQIKIVFSVLDKLGLPLTVRVVPGNCADDPLYIPAMEQVKKTTGQKGLLFVGDCKMGAIATRLHVVNNGDYYLSPLSEVSHSSQETLLAVQSFQENGLPLTQVTRTYFDGKDAVIAEGFEKSVIRSCEQNGEIMTWNERLIYAKSFAHAKKSVISLNERLKSAQSEIKGMNIRGKGKAIYRTVEEATEKASSILAVNRVKGLIDVAFSEIISEKPKRKYGEKPDRVERTVIIQVEPSINAEALKNAQEGLGWRVYVTNKSVQDLPIEDVVMTYRDQYIIEHQFHRLKGKALSIAPIFIQRDDRIDGLVKFLTIVMRPLVIIEKKIRDSIKKRGEGLSGLFEYNPTKTVINPKTERIIEFFVGVYLSITTFGDQVFYLVTGLNEKHWEILRLMGIDPNIYANFGTIQETST